MNEHLKVDLTVDDFNESFWVMPTGDHEGEVANVLLAGVINMGDTVRWNDDLQVTDLVARSGRVNLAIRPDLHPEDLAGQAAWANAVEEALPRFEAAGIRVEGMGTGLLMSIKDDSLAGHTSDQITDDMVNGWLDLIPGNTRIEFSVGSAGGDPIDNEFLQLTVPEPEPQPMFDREEVAQTALDVFERCTDEKTRVYERLVEAGHINKTLDEDDVICTAAISVLTDARARYAWNHGHVDQVLVFAGRIEASHAGLLMPHLDAPVFQTDFLS